MPTFFFYGPKIELDKKKIMIKEITAAASKATGIPENLSPFIFVRHSMRMSA